MGASKHAVAMICDFFFPSIGGVENHVHQLSQCLLHSHKVIVITHRHGSRVGVRWLASGLKVYCVPFASVYDRCLLPMGFLFLPLLRNILVREHIDVVHTHAVCSMAFESVILAALLCYRLVHTEHSTFCFSGLTDLCLNWLEELVLAHADFAISVSHLSKENLILRCKIDPSRAYVIPNAVDASLFRPERSKLDRVETLNIVVLTRLVWRKGVHLLVQLVPEICERFPFVRFIIGGDGPNRHALEEMRERRHLQSRVELLGTVQHCDVPTVLTRGNLFLSTSLTEAFCIAVLEAVSCGLIVVSTRVGGVPEILPQCMLLITEQKPRALLTMISNVIPSLRTAAVVTRKQQWSHQRITACHHEVARMYGWQKVAMRTVCVYDGIAMRPMPTLPDRLRKLAGIGPWAASIAICIVALQHLLLSLLRLCRPAEKSFTLAMRS